MKHFSQTLLPVMASLLFVAFASNAPANDWKEIRIGVEGAYPPFSETKPDGSVVGFDIDIANALCREIGASCSMVKQDWDGMIPALLARKYDAIIASMSITEERKKQVSFTNKYYSSPARFVRASKDTNIRILNSKLDGLNVGVQQETIMDRFLTDNWGDIVNVRRYGTQEDANNDMLSGRLDLIFAEIGPASSFIETHGSRFEFIGPSYADPEWFGEGIGIAIRKSDSDLQDKFNDAISAIRANGTYDDIQGRYFSYDIYGD